MKQQILVIHGADSFLSYEDYLDALQKSASWNRIEDFNRKDWKGNLSQVLGDDYQVITPRMPNKNNARYLEWKIWLDGFIDQIDENAIFIGHSMGGIFLAKYLSETKRNYKALVLVAAPFGDGDEGRESLGDFNFDDKNVLKNLADDRVTLFHSTDDAVVPYADSDMYLAYLPHAKRVTLEGRSHSNQETFPEVAQLIRSL